MSRNSGKEDTLLDGSDLRIGIVAALYNKDKVDRLIELVVAELKSLGVIEEHIRLERVPGSMEIPYATARLARHSGCEAIIGLGVVIAGATSHHDVIGYSTAISLQKISIDFERPVINGILVVDSEEQATERLGAGINRGAEFAKAAVSLANLG
ncbi:MAG: 6,7-dimethyl-8-ribityllumazine synthase [Verrucomicrobiota bacterium]